MSEAEVYACKRSVVDFVGAKSSDILGEVVAGSGNFCITGYAVDSTDHNMLIASTYY